jgi:polar amino acid transport system substrate-binding protein
MTRLAKSTFVVVAVLTAAMTATACGGDDEKPTTAKLRTLKAGTLTVGSDTAYPPFEFGQPPNYKGFDIDLVNELAKRLKLKATIVKSAFNPILRSLAQGRFDMVASATAITDEAKRTVDFSDPYFAADQSIVTKKGSGVRSVDDLDGKRVGAQLGTTGSEYARDKTDAIVRNFDAYSDAFNALEAGQVNAVIHNFPQSQQEVEKRKGLKIVESVSTGEFYGLAFAKRNDALREEVNTVLQEMKDDGAYTRIYRKWFKQDPPKSILDSG